MKARVTLRHDVSRELTLESIIEELLSNKCIYCLQHGIKNGNYIDTQWRDVNINHCWPRPYQESDIIPHTVKGIVVGQDPTIDNPRLLEYVLEANLKDSLLGRFLRDVFNMLPSIRFNEFYFTNLVKCRFNEKPGKGKRNITQFIDRLASECYARFLIREIEMCENAKYIFTLGRDNFSVLSHLLHVNHPALVDFKNFYGTKFIIPFANIGRECFLIPLPHQPTYELANRYSPYVDRQR